MEIKVTLRELDIILSSLNGTRFDDIKLEAEKGCLLTKLIEERKGEYDD